MKTFQIIEIHRPEKEILFYSKNMSIYQAVHQLGWTLKNRCKECSQQCTDCYFDYPDKIAVEKLLEYFLKNKRKIKGVKK